VKKVITLISLICAIIHYVQAEESIKRLNAKDRTESILKGNAITFVGDFSDITGISPDGSYCIFQQRKDDGYSLMFMEIATGKIIRTIQLGKTYSPQKCRPVWSNDGRFFTLYSSGPYPESLKFMQGTWQYRVDCSTGGIETVSDAMSVGSILENGYICYNSFFTDKDTAIVFNRYFGKSTSLIKKTLGMKGEQVELVRLPGSDGFCNILETHNGNFFCTKEPFEPSKPASVVIIDGKTKEEKILFRNETVMTGMPYRYQIAGFTRDRKTVLLNRWTEKFGEVSFGRGIESIHILDLTTGKISMDEIRPSKDRMIKSSILSSDGSYVVFTEGTGGPDNDTIMLFDRKEKKRSVIFSNKRYSDLSGKPPLMILGNQNTPMPGGISLSDNNRLIVWFANGWFVVNLSD
jgi:hypothetical protein